MDALLWVLQALGFVLLGLGVVIYVVEIRRERRWRDDIDWLIDPAPCETYAVGNRKAYFLGSARRLRAIHTVSPVDRFG